MNPITGINSQIQDLSRLRQLAAEPSQGVTKADLSKLDADKDGKLSERELKAFSGTALKSELKQRFSQAQGSAQAQLPLFNGPELDIKLTNLREQRQTLASAARKGLEGKTEAFNRSLLNHFDSNEDGALGVQEIRAIDPQKFKSLGDDYGIKPQELNSLLKNLNILADIKAAELAEARNFAPETACDPKSEVVLSPTQERDFASGMRFEGDPAADAITAARKGKQSAAFKTELLNLTQNAPTTVSLLKQLDKQGQLSQENLFYLKTIASSHGPETFKQLAPVLENYLKTPAPGALITANERKTYLNNLLQDLAFPEDINQGEKGTCAATAIQIELARRQPVKYLEVATSLANNQPVDLQPTAQGERRTLYPNLTYKGDPDDDRNLSARLIQNSLMNLGHQAGENNLHYFHQGRLIQFDSRMSIDTAQGLTADQSLTRAASKIPELRGLEASTLERLGDGLSEGEMEYVGQGFFGNHWRDLSTQDKDKQRLLEGLDQALEQGRKVTVGSEDHAMTVLDKRLENGKQFYRVASWSGVYQMTPEALKQRLTNVFVDSAPVSP